MSTGSSYPSDLAERFQVRMPPGLRGQIAEAAKANNRSMNAEIVARLEASFSDNASADELARELIEGFRSGRFKVVRST